MSSSTDFPLDDFAGVVTVLDPRRTALRLTRRRARRAARRGRDRAGTALGARRRRPRGRRARTLRGRGGAQARAAGRPSVDGPRAWSAGALLGRRATERRPPRARARCRTTRTPTCRAPRRFRTAHRRSRSRGSIERAELTKKTASPEDVEPTGAVREALPPQAEDDVLAGRGVDLAEVARVLVDVPVVADEVELARLDLRATRWPSRYSGCARTL